MKPDAFIRIESTDDEHAAKRQVSLFFELDRSTEAQQNLRGRASGYLDFYRTGDLLAVVNKLNRVAQPDYPGPESE